MKNRLRLTRIVLLLAALPGGACVSLEQAAPPVAALSSHVPAGERARLERGRDLYVTKCAKCHSVEPVKKYPLAKWEHDILPDMNEETKLSPEEGAAVRAYVLAVLRS